jgi:hypothetical protein
MTFHAVHRWRVPLGGQAPADLPAEWADSLAAVGRDLRCRRHGRTINVDGLEWELTVAADGWVSIGMSSLTDDAGIYRFSLCQSYTFKTTVAQAKMWIAETVQDKLSGHEFVQWPSDGWRMLTPEVRDGEAVWVAPSTDNLIAPIGELCSQLPHAD